MRVHAWAIAVLVRTLMLFGYVVVMIGRARSGKTLILERATPNKVVNKSKERWKTGVAPAFAVEELPDGYFSIDEANQFEPSALVRAIAALAGRSFAISFQRYNDLESIGLDRADILGGRRRVVLMLN